MQIYDCFLFFDELDLLEIRLNYLSPAVNYFVLAESTKTFSLKNKPLYFKENRERFSKFLHKMIYILVDDFNSPDPWVNERNQRDSLDRGVQHVDPDDLILVSDLDEIPSREGIAKFDLSKKEMGFRQKVYYYYLNGFVDIYWRGTAAFLAKNRPKKFSSLRKLNSHTDVIDPGGWHFSFLGQIDRIQKKIDSFSHQEFNRPEYTDPEKLKQKIEQGKDIFNRPEIVIQYVPIDDAYPDYILRNRERFEKFIRKI